jgi:superfamily I DNA/RNA helicase
LQSRTIEVANFHDWARDLLDRAGVELSRSDFADGMFEGRLLEAIRSGLIKRRYDAVIIDEGQDFSQPMLSAAKEILDDGRNGIFVAMDNAQRIYESRAFPMSAVGLSSTNKPRILKVNERCSREINEFSRRFMWGEVAEGTGVVVGGQTVWIPKSGDRTGDRVVVARCRSLRGQVRWAADWCLGLLARGHLPDEIAVLYARSRAGADGVPLDRPSESAEESGVAIDLAKLVREVFEREGIDTWWLAEDRSSKADATVIHSRVTVSTIASFKGLEAKNVVLFGADATAEEDSSTRMRYRSLLYVGMTRATHRLAVPWTRSEGFGPILTELPEIDRGERLAESLG